MRKRIALLVGQVQEQYQAEFTEGFLKKAFGMDMDVCIFSTYQRDPETDEDGIGEGYIFSAVQYDAFDSVVVLPDTLRTKGLVLMLEKSLEDYKGKVLYVDKKTEVYPYIVQSNYRPMYRATEHLITEHGYTEIGFMNGIKNHAHSIVREEAFRQCMKDHGLKVNENWITYGDYWYAGAERAAKILINQNEKMPRAILCANDYMAIALAGVLEKNGYKVPEDVAIMGFDSVEAGQNAPQPITSIPMSSTSYGEYAADCVKNLLEDKPLQPFEVDEPLYIGTSCGCKRHLKTTKLARHGWTTTDINYYIHMTKLLEEFVLQTSFQSIMDSVQTYTYQIREFESMCICLNESWKEADTNVEATREIDGFTDNMLLVLSCGRSGEGADKLDFETTFNRKEMIPALYKEVDHPRAFFITPLCHAEKVFGYASISYGDEVKCVDDNYMMWLRSFMVALENFYRNASIRQSGGEKAPVEILDSLTGMFNYEGFTKHARPMVDRAKSEDLCTSILAVDIAGLDAINSKYSRKEGDQAIRKVSQMIFGVADEGDMCCRLGNDEFILAKLTMDASGDQISKVRTKIYDKLDEYNKDPKNKYQIKIHTGSATIRVNNMVAMEDLVNAAVSDKNGNKISEQKMQMSVQLTKEEEEKAELVKKILDENLFKYNFQPIVSAKDGTIFAYEALMRSKTDVFVSPLEILRFASHLNRLVAVEKATFFNVLEIVGNQEDKFKGKKIFINSIPGQKLADEEMNALQQKMLKLREHIVVELTEQTEADDESLANMKRQFEAMGIESAVDDYGTGYSNIVNLLRYMPNYVKIDRMLLTGIQDNRQKQHFVKDIVLFAKENRFKVLAEGVETTEELKTVIELGVDLIQGYYTARPSEEIIPSIDTKIMEEICQYSAEQNHADWQ